MTVSLSDNKTLLKYPMTLRLYRLYKLIFSLCKTSHPKNTIIESIFHFCGLQNESKVLLAIRKKFGNPIQVIFNKFRLSDFKKIECFNASWNANQLNAFQFPQILADFRTETKFNYLCYFELLSDSASSFNLFLYN